MSSAYSASASGSNTDAVDRPRALVCAPSSLEVELVEAALGDEWDVVQTELTSELEDVDARTRVVVIDDRFPGSVLDRAKLVLDRAPAAQVLLALGPESVGEILRAGLERVRVSWAFRPFTAATLAAELRDVGPEREGAGAAADRRAFPRAALEEPAVVAPAGVDLRDISPGGALLVAPPGWEVGSHVQLELRLASGAPVQRVVGEIIRVDAAALGRQAVVARFVEPTARFQSLVRAMILEHMTYHGLRELPRRFREEASSCAPIADADRVDALLADIHAQRRPCILSATRRGRPWRSTLLRLDAAGQQLELRRATGDRRVRLGDAIDVFVHGTAESYLFEARVADITDVAIACAWPEVVYYSEKRADERRAVPPEAHAVVEIDAPPPWGKRAWPLHDVSTGGLSCLVPESGAVLLPGTPLRPLRVRVGGRVVAEHIGEVRHVAPLADGAVRVGIVLVEAPRPAAAHPRGSASPGAARPERPRPPATRSSHTGARRVRFLNSHNEVVSALYDTSVVSDHRFATPVVIVAPAFGRSKECFSSLSHWLCDRFGRLGEPVAVLRFDFTHSKGESYIPECNRGAGRECLDFTLSSALDDLRAAIRFVHHTPLFAATSVIVVGYSMSAPLALKAAASDPRISHVISVMGAPSVQEAIRNVTGGLDYVGGHLKGQRYGVVSFLGQLVDIDELCRDAVAADLATARDAQRDMAALPVTVSWLLGEHDGWVDRRALDHLLATKRRGARPDMVVLPTGHVPTVSDEAAAVAEETTRLVWRTVHGGEIPPAGGPSPEALERIARDEWARAPRAAVADRRAYWADYLLGPKGQGELAFDVLEQVRGYRELMALQACLLETLPGQRVLDAGGGTGNFLAALLDSALPLPAHVELADLVPQALERARTKTRAAAERTGVEVALTVKTLEVSRLRPIERFVRGEVHGPEWLRGRVEGLDDRTLDRVLELYGPAMHATLRGAPLVEALASALSDQERAVVLDLGRAARLVRGCLLPDDFRPDAAASAARGIAAVRTSHLRFERLGLGDTGVDERLDLETAGYDRIVASLVLPYLVNPDETVGELHRALKPGGRLVVSSNRPNTDMSVMFTELVEDVSRGHVPPPPGMDRERFLGELRAYTSSAAFLLRLAEEQTFRLFSGDELRHMLELAGFCDVVVVPSFGDPPQAFVAMGVKA